MKAIELVLTPKLDIEPDINKHHYGVQHKIFKNISHSGFIFLDKDGLIGVITSGPKKECWKPTRILKGEGCTNLSIYIEELLKNNFNVFEFNTPQELYAWLGSIE